MFLQIWPVTFSINKANDCRSQSHGREKIKLEEEAIVKFRLLTLPLN